MEAGVDGLPSCCCSWVLLLEAAALVWEQKLEGNCVVGAGAGQGKKDNQLRGEVEA